MVADGANSKFYDMHGVGNVAPVNDTQQDLTGYSVLDGRQVYFYLSRNRDTNDPKDYLIMLASEIPCAWAINNASKDIK